MRITSLKKFLVVSICSVMLITSAVTIIWSYNTVNNNFAKLFDVLLVDDAKAIRTFLKGDILEGHYADIQGVQNDLEICDPNDKYCEAYKLNSEKNKQNNQIAWANNFTENYESETIFQVWTIKDNKLLLRSTFAPKVKFAEFNNGFADSSYNNIKYRVYTQTNADIGIIVQTAQSHEIRNHLAHLIVTQLLYPIILVTPILLLLIFFVIKLAADSINHVTDAVKKRNPRNLDLLNIKHSPEEILPLVSEINRLFELINHSFAREQRFNSDAAHELKTPLAAIKVQAQVAKTNLMSFCKDNLDKTIINIDHIIEGVNRSDHIVSQLLTLSRLAPDQPLKHAEICPLDKITRAVIADSINHALNKNIEISLDILTTADNKANNRLILTPEKEITLLGNKTLLNILIRNLIDNAIKYSGENSKITVRLISSKSKIILEVRDTGPGLTKLQKQRVFDRFYRVPGNQADGSGLGLSIVKLIADLHNASIKLSDNEEEEIVNKTRNKGLCIKITFKID